MMLYRTFQKNQGDAAHIVRDFFTIFRNEKQIPVFTVS